jgi:NADH-quinone oxidoreductase subunit G
MRVWFLKQTNSIDTESSVGANTVVWSREGVVYRITPRQNDAVNDTWMADSGRILYKEVRGPGRLESVRVNGAESALDFAVKAAAELLAGAGGRRRLRPQLGRGAVPDEKLAAAAKAEAWLVSRVGEGDKLLISADRNPNVRGALVTGLISALPSASSAELGAQIDAGSVRTVVSVGEDLRPPASRAAQLAKVSVIYLGTHSNATSAAARSSSRPSPCSRSTARS